MLVELYPRVHRRYSSLSVLGTILDGYAEWLSKLDYPRNRIRHHLRTARRLDRALQGRGVHSLEELTRERLRICAPAVSQSDPDLRAVVRFVERYLDTQGALPPAPPPGRIEIKVASYATYLTQVRGLAAPTVAQHSTAAAEFLAHMGYEAKPARLAEITGRDVEAFMRTVGGRLGRASLQHTASQIRSFLRFLASSGEAPPGLDSQIDTPRVYRDEQLPRSLPWESVGTLLRSIDRTSRLGLRDYTMLLLIATYGLRSSEVVALRLDDIEWRAERIRIPQRKTSGSFWLPLTDEVGAALLDYLRRGRPALAYREVFLRGRAPAGVLKPTALFDVFQKWSRRSGLHIPVQGAHCLRHSYAVHLLRQGTSLKTIGDLLGHRSLESTCVYLRLAVEDLRDVALPLPRGLASRGAQEVAP